MHKHGERILTPRHWGEHLRETEMERTDIFMHIYPCIGCLQLKPDAFSELFFPVIKVIHVQSRF